MVTVSTGASHNKFGAEQLRSRLHGVIVNDTLGIRFRLGFRLRFKSRFG